MSAPAVFEAGASAALPLASAWAFGSAGDLSSVGFAADLALGAAAMDAVGAGGAETGATAAFAI